MIVDKNLTLICQKKLAGILYPTLQINMVTLEGDEKNTYYVEAAIHCSK